MRTRETVYVECGYCFKTVKSEDSVESEIDGSFCSDWCMEEKLIEIGDEWKQYKHETLMEL